MRKTLILALMCAASLAACQKDETGAEGLGPQPGAEPLLAGVDEGAQAGDPAGVAGGGGGGGGGQAAAPPVAAADGSRPIRKAGLWLITRTTTGGPAPGANGGQRGAGGGAPGGQRANGGGGGAPGGAPGGQRANGGGGGAPGGAAGGQRANGGGGAPGGGGGGQRGLGGGGGFAAGGAQGPEKLCVDDASEAIRGVFAAVRGGADCTPKLVKSGTTWTQSSTCTNPGRGGGASSTTSTTETLTGDLNTRYSIRGVTKVTGGQADFTRTTTTTGVYQGACPAGQKGGDMTDATGQTRNILQGGGGGGGGQRGAGRQRGGG